MVGHGACGRDLQLPAKDDAELSAPSSGAYSTPIRSPYMSVRPCLPPPPIFILDDTPPPFDQAMLAMLPEAGFY